jgi:hypothetical protein
MRTPFRIVALFSLIGLALLCAGSAPALASTEGPGFEASAEAWPTHLPPGGEGLILLAVANVGAANTSGSVTVTDVLPPGVTATDAGAQVGEAPGPSHEPELWDCHGTTVVTCTNDPVNLPALTGGGGNSTYAISLSGELVDPRISIAVKVAPGVSGTVLNHLTVTGGGAPTPAGTTDPITISETPAPFGVSDFDVWFSNADGTIDTQAGSHPYAATFVLGFNQKGAVRKEGGEYNVGSIRASAQVRNIEVELPPGLVGNPTGIPQCPRELFENDQYHSCPADTQIGVVTTNFGVASDPTEPVFNIAPPPGKPAQFGFTILGNPTTLDSRVRTGTDNGITTDVFNVPQRNIQNSVVTLWSDPGDPSHARWSGAFAGCHSEECVEQLAESKPLLTLPTACAGPQKFTVRMHPWFDESTTAEASILSHDAAGNPAGFTGCEHLAFAPTITTAPDTSRTDTPAGLTVTVTPPVGGLLSDEGVSSADIQNTTVTLPEGMVINPGQAAGLAACPASQDAIGSEAAPSCPAASKVGVVSIDTPLLPDKVEGDVYVLQSNPPEVKLLVAASADGVNLKLVGVVHLNEQTGQLATTFEGTPQLPFSEFKLSFSGGPQAALDTPTQCGSYTTNADLSPWSSPFVADFLTNASFVLSEGPGGAACSPNPLPFGPSLTAGSTTDQAAGFTGFSLLLQRDDGQQRIEKLSFKAPAGLSGMISRVPLCDDADASTGACPAVSHIGHAVVTSGPGPYPLVLPQPGAPELPIYLTGPYDGAPFGLSIVTPVIAGPFDLGTIVTRAKIEIDPHTAQITVTTDPLPQIVKGVPTDLRSIDAVIDRPGFMFNPSNCDSREFAGTATSTQGASAPIASHFQVGSCQSLRFAPKFTVSTTAKTSRAKGAALTAKLSYPTAAQGTQANLTRVKVDLPKQLPSRLTTLQKACTAAQFEANPADCPAASIVGHATVTTPLLPVPLTGPAYFVSHGGEAFPSLTMVLQGYGVTIDLVGATFISKAGITSTTFKTVPDVPFSTFALTLPQGKYSALAANGNLCKSKLAMPTEFLAQNGLKINKSTPISVSGCAKTKALTRAQKLSASLKACHKKRDARREACEKTARTKYGTKRKRA